MKAKEILNKYEKIQRTNFYFACKNFKDPVLDRLYVKNFYILFRETVRSGLFRSKHLRMVITFFERKLDKLKFPFLRFIKPSGVTEEHLKLMDYWADYFNLWQFLKIPNKYEDEKERIQYLKNKMSNI